MKNNLNIKADEFREEAHKEMTKVYEAWNAFSSTKKDIDLDEFLQHIGNITSPLIDLLPSFKVALRVVSFINKFEELLSRHLKANPDYPFIAVFQIEEFFSLKKIYSELYTQEEMNTHIKNLDLENKDKIEKWVKQNFESMFKKKSNE